MARDRKPPVDEIDESPLLDKVKERRFRAINAGDVAGVASTTANIASSVGPLAGKGFFGPVIGSTLPVLDVVGVAADGVKGKVEAEAAYQRVSRRFGNFKQLAKRIPAFRQKQIQIDSKAQSNMLEAGVSAGGGMAGGAAVGAMVGAMVGTFAIPVPIIGSISGTAIGGVVGAMTGSIAASKLYHTFCVKQAQDPVIINEQICQMREAGQEVPKELVFAALAASLTGKAGKRVDKLLKRYTGTTLFTEALADEENLPKLAAMMNDRGVRNAIRAKTNLPRDMQNPAMSVSEQYTQAINSGVLDPALLLDNAAAVYCIQQHAIRASMPSAAPAPEVPVTPGMERANTRSV